MSLENHPEKTENITQAKQSTRFQLHEHPWISVVVLLVWILVNALIGKIIFQLIAPIFHPGYPYHIAQSVFGYIWGFLGVLLVIPFLFRLPTGKTTFKKYIDTIRLSRVKPIARTVFLFASCYGIFLGSQILATMVYNSIFAPAGGFSVVTYFTPAYIIQHLPPNNWSIFLATGSGLFEEILFRGVVLTMFLRKYSERQSIGISAIIFGCFHAMNFLNVIPPTYQSLIWVSGQIVWTSIVGVFYGYLFIRANSLWPSITIHYLGNAFMNYWVFLPAAPVEIEVLLGITLVLGIVPTSIAILWITLLHKQWFSKSIPSSLPTFVT